MEGAYVVLDHQLFDEQLDEAVGDLRLVGFYDRPDVQGVLNDAVPVVDVGHQAI